MDEKLVKIFNNTKCQPNEDLTFKVWRAIVLEDKRVARFKLWTFSLLGIFSLVGFIPVFKLLSNDWAQSGFFEYLSVLFSNGSIIAYWRELGLSILESLPTVSLIFMFSLIFILFLSVKYTIKQLTRSSLRFSL